LLVTDRLINNLLSILKSKVNKVNLKNILEHSPHSKYINYLTIENLKRFLPLLDKHTDDMSIDIEFNLNQSSFNVSFVDSDHININMTIIESVIVYN
jgi:hypothetical protein